MEFTTRQYINEFIEITVADGSAALTADVTDMEGKVPLALIEQLKQVVEDLEDFNESK